MKSLFAFAALAIATTEAAEWGSSGWGGGWGGGFFGPHPARRGGYGSHRGRSGHRGGYGHVSQSHGSYQQAQPAPKPQLTKEQIYRQQQKQEGLKAYKRPTGNRWVKVNGVYYNKVHPKRHYINDDHEHSAKAPKGYDSYKQDNFYN